MAKKDALETPAPGLGAPPFGSVGAPPVEAKPPVVEPPPAPPVKLHEHHFDPSRSGAFESLEDQAARGMYHAKMRAFHGAVGVAAAADAAVANFVPGPSLEDLKAKAKAARAARDAAAAALAAK